MLYNDDVQGRVLMITKPELLLLLSACYAEFVPSEDHIEDKASLLDGIANGLLNIQKNQEFPSYQDLCIAPEIRALFGEILTSSNAKYKQNHRLYKQVERESIALQIKIEAKADEIALSLDDTVADEDSVKCFYDLIEAMQKNPGAALFDCRGLKMFMNNIRNELTSAAINGFKEKSNTILTQRLIAMKSRITLCQLDREIDSEIIEQLIRLSLKIHAEKCTSDRDASAGVIRMINFYGREAKNAEPHFSEYLSVFDSDDEKDEAVSFNKTNHGLGSGLYGLAYMSSQAIEDAIEKRRCYKIFEIRNPLRLHDSEGSHESNALTELSKYLQVACDEIKSTYYKTLDASHLNLSGKRTKKESAHLREKAVIDFFHDTPNELQLREHAKILFEFKNVKKIGLKCSEIEHILLASTIDFFVGASPFNGILTVMPINYVIKKLGFTGISSEYNDSFNRGLIAFETSTHSPLRQIGIKGQRTTTTFFGKQSMSCDSSDSLMSMDKNPSRSSTPAYLNESQFYAQQFVLSSRNTTPEMEGQNNDFFL